VTNEHVDSLSFSVTDWRGDLPTHLIGQWLDFALLLLIGGVPWQCYFQRVLSSKTSKRAVYLSYGACAIAICMAIPATFFGAVAKATR
jgi:high affinity choline transporter 7